MRFKIDWASLIVGSKFTVFVLFYFVFEGNFPSTSPRGAYIWRGDLTEGFLRYRFGGLIFRGAYTRGLFAEFYGISSVSRGPIVRLWERSVGFFFFNCWQAKHTFEIFCHSYCLPSFTNSLLRTICSAGSLPLSLMKKI